MATPSKTTSERAPHTTLRAAICGVVADTGNVPKSGTNKFHGYKYATDADIMQECRAAMARHGVTLTLCGAENVREKEMAGGKGVDQYYFADFVFEIGHADSEQTMIVKVPGGGQDKGEKAAYKALTGAKKYLYLTTFALATGADDPEDDRGTGDRGGQREDVDLSRYVPVDEVAQWGRAIEAVTKLRATRCGSLAKVLPAERAAQVKSSCDLSGDELRAYTDYLKRQPTTAQRDRFQSLCADLVLDAGATTAVLAAHRQGAATFEDLTAPEADKAIVALTAMLAKPAS